MTGIEPTVPRPAGTVSGAGGTDYPGGDYPGGDYPGGPQWPPPRPPGGRWSPKKAALVGVGLLVAIAVGAPIAIASHDAGQYFVFSPGTAPVITTSPACKPSRDELYLPDGSPCVRLEIPASKARPFDGQLLMVDVEVAQASVFDWAEYQLGLLGKQRQLVPVAAYAGSTPTSELGCQDSQEMVSANQDAAIAALATLHYHVAETPLGAEVNEVLGNTPAWGAGIKCNDLITAVNGQTVQSAAAFAALLKPLAPGTRVTFTDHPASGGPVKRLRARLVAPPAATVAEGFTNRAYLGVSVDTRVRPVLPFPISVDAGDIGGPSAGLAFSLAIIDALSNGKLTGGHKVAATGTIDAEGNVGDVGGVQEKTAAVQKAGAQIFFVPNDEYQAAAGVAGKGLDVVPVSTLRQVLGILQQRYGGYVPGATTSPKT